MTKDKSILIKNIYYMLSYAFQVLKQSNYDDVASEKFDKPSPGQATTGREPGV